MCKIVPPDLNIKREQIVFKGYANIPDIAVFANVSYSKAKKYYAQMKADAIKEKKKVKDRMISAKRLLEYFDLTEEKVFEFANMERERQKEKDAPAVESKAS